jgi:hemolysin activation/secretion protein
LTSAYPIASAARRDLKSPHKIPRKVRVRAGEKSLLVRWLRVEGHVRGVRAIAAAWAMVCVSFAAVAQNRSVQRSAWRERFRFETPTRPLAQPGGPIITQPGVEAPPGAAETRLRVRKVTIVGSTVYTAAQLAELYADLIGETVTLKEVYELAGKITAKYGADGYVLSRAIIPPQELDPNGADIRIQVVEGYIEKVEWPPQLDKYRDFFSDYAAKITAERPANIRTIERYLLLAGDLPGLKFKNTIKPHPSLVGAAILVVEVTEKPADLFMRADNRGTPARGPIQGLTTVTANNLLRIHEAFSFTYAGSSKPRELQYQALNYRQVLTSEGLTGFFNASYGHGRPGTFPLEILDYRTQSQYTEVGLTYPVIRARERNFNLTGLWFWSDDRSSFFDMPNDPPSTLDKLRGFRLRAETDWADQFAGINQLSVTVSHGFQGLAARPTTTSSPRAPTAGSISPRRNCRSRGCSRCSDTFSVLLAAYGQNAFTPLLVSELCGYGGRVFGRGFDPSQFVSDTCFEWLAELRYDIPCSSKGLPRPSYTPSPIMAGSTILPRFWAHSRMWMPPLLELGTVWLAELDHR